VRCKNRAHYYFGEIEMKKLMMIILLVCCLGTVFSNDSKSVMYNMRKVLTSQRELLGEELNMHPDKLYDLFESANETNDFSSFVAPLENLKTSVELGEYYKTVVSYYTKHDFKSVQPANPVDSRFRPWMFLRFASQLEERGAFELADGYFLKAEKVLRKKGVRQDQVYGYLDSPAFYIVRALKSHEGVENPKRVWELMNWFERLGDSGDACHRIYQYAAEFARKIEDSDRVKRFEKKAQKAYQDQIYYSSKTAHTVDILLTICVSCILVIMLQLVRIYFRYRASSSNKKSFLGQLAVCPSIELYSCLFVLIIFWVSGTWVSVEISKIGRMAALPLQVVEGHWNSKHLISKFERMSAGDRPFAKYFYGYALAEQGQTKKALQVWSSIQTVLNGYSEFRYNFSLLNGDKKSEQELSQKESEILSTLGHKSRLLPPSRSMIQGYANHRIWNWQQADIARLSGVQGGSDSKYKVYIFMLLGLMAIGLLVFKRSKLKPEEKLDICDCGNVISKSQTVCEDCSYGDKELLNEKLTSKDIWTLIVPGNYLMKNKKTYWQGLLLLLISAVVGLTFWFCDSSIPALGVLGRVSTINMDFLFSNIQAVYPTSADSLYSSWMFLCFAGFTITMLVNWWPAFKKLSSKK
jgi:tetratricopeptide (TPR) repeat protein